MTEQQSRPRTFVRTVIGVLLIAGMAGGYYAMGQQRADRQRAAVETIEQCGGLVYLDYQWRDGAPDPRGISPEQTWTRRLLGSAWFDRVVAVDLTQAADVDRAVGALRWLPYLQSLNAQDTPISDEAVRQLGRLTSLRTLNLARTQTADDAVDPLENLKLLKQLDLRGTKMSAAGVKRLQAALRNGKVLADDDAG